MNDFEVVAEHEGGEVVLHGTDDPDAAAEAARDLEREHGLDVEVRPTGEGGAR